MVGGQPMNDARLEAAQAVITAFAAAIGDCTCSEAYTSRGLRDPHCRYDEYLPELTMAADWLTAATTYRQSHCGWRRSDEFDEPWAGDCGILWVFTDAGAPQEHGVNFCPRCGRPVSVVEGQA